MLVCGSVSLSHSLPFHQHQHTRSNLHGTVLAQNFHYYCTWEQTLQAYQLIIFAELDTELNLDNKMSQKLLLLSKFYKYLSSLDQRSAWVFLPNMFQLKVNNSKKKKVSSDKFKIVLLLMYVTLLDGIQVKHVRKNK